MAMLNLFGRKNRIKKQKRKIARTVQQSIPIDAIYKDGIFRTGRLFSKSWKFSDINYAVASDDDQLQMFLAHSAILNGLPTDAMAEITIYNRQLHNKVFEQITTPSDNPNYRKYTKEQYLNLVEKMKKEIPNVTFSTDIIVGFPGETDEEFEDTLDVVEKVNFEQVYMFIYSRRVGTPADKMENQVPEEQKHIRFNKLKMLVEQQIANKNKQYIDTKQKVLVEGKSKNNDNMLTGRTDSNKVVIFEGEDNLIGKVIDLKIVSEHMWYLKGKII